VTDRSRWTTLYALLSGVCGLAILTLPFMLRDAATDLPDLLLITVVVLVVSYFRVPISTRAPCGPALASLWSTELSLDGALLLGATLARGAALGAWAAFIAGLVTPFVPHMSPPPDEPASGPSRWSDRAAAGLLDSGRNIVALSLGWLAYRGLGGTRAPGQIDGPLALALGILFVTFGLIRSLWAWPVLVLAGETPRRALERLFAPGKLALEWFALPIALLVSATLSGLGWSNFFLLVLVLVGLGAVMRQMTRTIQRLHQQVALYEFRDRVRTRIDAGPQTVEALCTLARSLCAELAPADRFEIGLYNSTRTQVTLRTTLQDGERLPPTSLPLSPLWEWLSTRDTPLLIADGAASDDLPFSLGPAGDSSYASAVLAPLVSGLARDGEPGDENDSGQARPAGAIVMLSHRERAFDQHTLACASEIARALGREITRENVST